MLNEDVMKKENIILSRTFDFSIQIIALYKELLDKKEFVLLNNY